MNICRYQDKVERWFDGELSDTGDFEAHLAGCSDCTERLEVLKLLRETVAPTTLKPEIADAQFPSFMERIIEENEAPKHFRMGRWAIASASALAAAIIVALSLISIVSPGPAPLQAVTIEESSTEIDGATTEVFINEETTMVWINLPDGDML